MTIGNSGESFGWVLNACNPDGVSPEKGRTFEAGKVAGPVCVWSAVCPQTFCKRAIEGLRFEALGYLSRHKASSFFNNHEEQLRCDNPPTPKSSDGFNR